MRKSSASDLLAGFGRIQMASEEIKAVGLEFGYALLNQARKANLGDQLEKFDDQYREGARSMAARYEAFFCLERSIRDMVEDQLSAEGGPDWWEDNKLVKENLRNEVELRVKRDKDSSYALRSERRLDFLNFGELGQLIQGNWLLFAGMLSSKSAVSKVISSLNVLRGPIAHCTQFDEDEAIRFELVIKDWLRCIN